MAHLQYSKKNGGRTQRFREREPDPAPGKAIGYFKYHCAGQINLFGATTGATVGRRDYYADVIRDERELENIRRYIKYNPQKTLY